MLPLNGQTGLCHMNGRRPPARSPPHAALLLHLLLAWPRLLLLLRLLSQEPLLAVGWRGQWGGRGGGRGHCLLLRTGAALRGGCLVADLGPAGQASEQGVAQEARQARGEKGQARPPQPPGQTQGLEGVKTVLQKKYDL